ncbi:hypothetical protein THO17_13250 [Marinomonas sp. THO17]
MFSKQKKHQAICAFTIPIMLLIFEKSAVYLQFLSFLHYNFNNAI